MSQTNSTQSALLSATQVMIVSHDAGGAEVLSAWLAKHGHARRVVLCVAGPAEAIFMRDHPALRRVALSFMGELEPGALVLTGTSGDADLERRAIACARRFKRCCASFLEHWTRYRERFGSADDWLERLPDEVWVGDVYAYGYACSQGFPQDRLVLTENPYFERIQGLAANQAMPGHDARLRVLFVGEPFGRKLQKTFPNTWQAYDDEKQNMRQFFSASQRFVDRLEQITLRLHPSEPPDKYNQLIEKYANGMPVCLSDGGRLADEIQQHHVVVGIESMGLIVAMLLDKPVYSCVTGKSWDISLPHRQIQRFSDYEKVFEHVLSDRAWPEPLSTQ